MDLKEILNLILVVILITFFVSLIVEMYNSKNNFTTPVSKKNTEINFDEEKPLLKNGKFDFKEMDIGGLDDECKQIFNRVISTRLIPAKVKKEMNIKNVRGILLHGEPGCGKTLIAKKMAKMLNCKSLKVISGPSLLNKFIGQSEENVRNLFYDAEVDSNPNNIHVVICDEFDSIAKKRTSFEDCGTSVNNNIVNQFLSKIDGPESLDNILLICTTNRIDLIDEAILRPGRIGVHIKIKKPDLKSRKEIFDIHLRKISESHRDKDIDVDELAKKAEDFSGAEIEGVVQNATTKSLNRVTDGNYETVTITQTDLLQGIAENVKLFAEKVNFPSLDMLAKNLNFG